MPRVARKKSKESMYHVMSRSISEKDLFQCDADRDHYLKLLKRYKEKYQCRIYSYCLMDNHVHIFIDPDGFDISTFMLSLNTAYVTYFNRRYERHGHLFQGRFASRTLEDDAYAVTLMAYIHNNAKDMPGYAGREEEYRYSSYGIYTGKRRDEEGIVDTGFLLGIFSGDKKIARCKCREYTEVMRGTGIMDEVKEDIIREFVGNEYVSGKSHLIRHENPSELIKRIREMLECGLREKLSAKYIRDAAGIRAFTTYVMRALCGYTYKRICEYIGNMSISGVSRLTNEGFKLVNNQMRYRHAFEGLMREN